MPSENPVILSLNAGIVGREGVHRVDLAKLRMAAEIQTNLLPRVLGPAQFRPGMGHLYTTLDDEDACCIPFVFSAETTARIELGNGLMRVLLDDGPLTRGTVTAAITNGDFDTDLTGWTDADEAGASSIWESGRMELTGTGENYAIRRQQVTVNEAGDEHALRIRVITGPVTFKVGSSSDADDYIEETDLKTGWHSLAFTPLGNFHITISSRAVGSKSVSSIAVESAGAVELNTPWTAGNIRKVRYDQSNDVLFCACGGLLQKRIERRSQRSWSIVDYTPEDGPFRVQNLTSTTLTPSAVSGNITITASRPVFKTGHAGALFRLTHSGQTVEATLGGDDQFSDYIRVTGLDPNRRFFFTIEGTFTGTLTLQRAFADPSGWLDVNTYTAPTTVNFNDSLDNQIVYYRIGFKSGDYGSGSADVTIEYSSSSQDGIVRISEYTSGTSVFAEVLSTLGRAEATSDWSEGEWSDYRGFPSAVALHDGRLWWGFKDRAFGSVSDAYDSYDDTVEGDSGRIVRSLTGGSQDGIYWMLSLQRLMAGTAMNESSVRSSSFDEPLTPTQFVSRQPSTRGSANIQAVKVDSRAIFVQRNLKRIFEMAFDVDGQDYASGDLTRLAPEICDAGVLGMAVQRMPDTRFWFWLTDGTAAVLTYEPADDLAAWVKVETAGFIRDVCVLPGQDEDHVFFVVKRTVNGVDHYYHEKLALMSECVGGTFNKTMDSFTVYDGAPAGALTGLTHLATEEVVAWADGAPLFTVDNPGTVGALGVLNWTGSFSNVVVGRAYTGRYKSPKLSYGAARGTALTFPKRISKVALMMLDVAWKGVKIGRNFDTATLTGLTPTYRGRPLDDDEVLGSYDYVGSQFNGSWDTDSRICFEVLSPYCATFSGLAFTLETNEQRVPEPRE